MSLGAALRIIVFVQNRSLFIDEASLSSQLVAKSFSELFGNFVYQYAPPFFNVLVKSSTEIFGATEYALRLIPLVAGLIGIWLFYQLCKAFLEPKHIIFPLLLFCFSMYMVRYATEVKQYASDIAICLGLLLFCLKNPVEKLSDKRFIIWSILGILSVWLSMPVVFVLFAIGVYYGVHLLKSKNQKGFIKLSFVALSWLISFGVYFFGIIKNDIGHEGLENYHSPFFFPLLPASLEEVHKAAQLILGFYRTAIGSTVIAIGWGILTTLLGFYQLFKKDRMLGWLFLLPILTCIAASGFKYYSLIPRLTLFFIPILLLTIGIGSQLILKKAPKYIAWLCIGILAIIVVNQKSYPYFFKKYQIEEIRPVLNYLAQNASPDDMIYVHYQAENAFRFYTQEYEYADRFKFKNQTIGSWDDAFPEVINYQEQTRIWLIFSHLKKEDMENILSAFEENILYQKSFEAEGAGCYLFQRKKLSD